MSSCTPTRQEFDSAARSALLSAVKGPRTGSKRSWTHRRTSQWPTPSITTVPAAPEPQRTLRTVRTDAMVIQLEQVARPVRTDLSVEAPSVEAPPVGAIPGHRIQGAARAGMTVGPLSTQLAGALTTATPTATHERAILKIQFSAPRAIFEFFKI
jgi:hypothetical protein